jgi:4-amino-4-deoxy-L-arabinose transferase-like glycosyltransferase
LHLRDSHFFTTDIAMVFLTVVTWWLLLRVADGAGAATTIKAGIVFGMAVAGKYTAVFLAPLIALAHVVASPIDQLRTARPWVRRLSLAALAGTIGLVVFLLIDPMVLRYPDRFREDIQEQVVGPVLGTDVQTRQFAAQFADINSKTYWFTNNLLVGLGPALEIWRSSAWPGCWCAAIAWRSWRLPFPSSTGWSGRVPSCRSRDMRFRSCRRSPCAPPA